MSISFKVLLAGIIMRLVFTIILLVIVWMHSHWSVALCLTLLAVDNESQNVIDSMKGAS